MSERDGKLTAQLSDMKRYHSNHYCVMEILVFPWPGVDHENEMEILFIFQNIINSMQSWQRCILSSASYWLRNDKLLCYWWKIWHVNDKGTPGKEIVVKP